MKKETKSSKSKIEKHVFQTETKELLNLMIHSLYTHKEIFLRELISNASDALDKLKIQSLMNKELLEEDMDFKITINIDKSNKTLTISDNGIGMSHDEVIENIGTIAKSGSKLFIEKFKELKDSENIDLIGQFGVGFYSSFMVAEKVILITRLAGEKSGTKWVSTADGTFTTEKVEKAGRGTEVILHLKEELQTEENSEDDFLNQYKIETLVKKYSDFVRYPILMDFYREEHPRDSQGNFIEGAESHTVIETKQINSMIPLWERDVKDISSEEYHQFYKNHYHDWNDCADIIHSKAEGQLQYTALLFIPSKAPSNLYDKEFSEGIQLYSNHVFVMKDCRALLPDHFRFVRGLVDSIDFSLNVSREILQHDNQLRIIGKHIEKKVLDSLKNLLADKRDKYEEMWKEYGKAIKGGIYMKRENVDKLKDLIMFSSSKLGSNKLSTLKEYTDRMIAGQTEVYYATGKDISVIERMPQLEVFKDNDIEILYFTDKIDDFLTQNISEYEGKKLKSISREDLNLDAIIKNKAAEQAEETEDKKDEASDHKELLKKIKDILGNKVKDVKISKRLKSSPVCLVSSSSGNTFNMEMLLKGISRPAMQASRILEINADHALFEAIKRVFEKDKDSEDMKNYSEIIYNQALLIEGLEIENPADFVEKLSKVMVKHSE